MISARKPARLAFAAAALPVLASLLAACSAESSSDVEGESDDAVRIGVCIAGTGVPSGSYHGYDEGFRAGPVVRGKVGSEIDMGNHTGVDVIAGALEVRHEDFSLCGNKLRLKEKVRAYFNPEGLDMNLLYACSKDASPARCNFVEPCVKSTIDVASGSCELKPNHPVEVRTFDIDCQPGGVYCGGDKVTGDPATLYRCRPGNRAEVVRACDNGCSVVRGVDDSCRTKALGTGAQAKEAVEAFYASDMGPAATRKYVDRGWLQEVQASNLGYNLLACGQDVAPRVTVDKVLVGHGHATMQVHHHFNGSNVLGTVLVSLESMQIVQTECFFDR